MAESVKKRQPDRDQELDTEIPPIKRSKNIESDDTVIDIQESTVESEASEESFGPQPFDSSVAPDWQDVLAADRARSTQMTDDLMSKLPTSETAEWMRLIPTEKPKGFDFNYERLQQNVSTFSKSTSSRPASRPTNTAAWTDSPEDAALRKSGSAKLSSLAEARRMAAERFRQEDEAEQAEEVKKFNFENRSMSLVDMVHKGAIPKSSKKDLSDDESSSSSYSSSDYSSDSDDRKSSKKHKHHDKRRKSKEKRKSKDKHRHKHHKKDSSKRKDKHSSKDEKKTSSSYAPEYGGSSTAFWDRERDMERFGSRASESTRKQVFLDASMIHTRFTSGGTSGTYK